MPSPMGYLSRLWLVLLIPFGALMLSVGSNKGHLAYKTAVPLIPKRFFFQKQWRKKTYRADTHVIVASFPGQPG